LKGTNPFALPYKWVCSKCKLGDIYWQPFNGLYFYNFCKVVATCAFDIDINTTIEVVDGPPCISHVKTPWLFPLFKFQEKDFMAKYSNEKVSMIELLGDLKVFGTFHLSPIGELVGYNERFQPQEVVVEVIREVVGDSSCAWIFLEFCFHWDILYFVYSSWFLYVDRSLLLIVRPHL